MKLTKKLEAEVAKVYDTWLRSYLNGDVKTYDSYLDTAYHFIGSTDNEDFLTKRETTKFFKTTAEQLAGKCQIKNNIRTIEQFDGLVFITERFDAYFLIGKKWVYYGKFRFSSVMQKKAVGWRFIYQHFSMPDSKAAEGETLGAEQVSKENQELRDAIKRRTAELEIKNHELEIETSLERVRAVAMSMQKPDDLFAIGKTIFSELQLLGFTSIRNTEMIINHDEKQSITSYHYSDYGKEEILKINYTQNKVVKNWAKELKKAENAFVPVKVAASKLKEWIAYRKKIGYKTDPGMRRAKAVHYYSYSIGLGALSVSTWQKISGEQIKILERFRNVFQLSYKRYKDIEQAEAQAREAQIEAALERVRSRSLAMHTTSELQEVINTVHQELLKLSIGINGGSFITINSEVDKELRCWGSGGTADTSAEVHIPYYKKPFYTNIVKRIKKGPAFFTEEFSQKEKKDFFTFLFKHEPWSKLKAKEKKETLSSPGGYTRSCCVSKHTSIFIINHIGEKFSAAENEILKRFGKVFEQTYTRFLDLQKAEAQARESQIEMALERVRSTSLAMHKSDELNQVILAVSKNLQVLGIEMENRATAIFTFEAGFKDYYQRVASPIYNSVISFLTPYIDHPVQNDIWNARQEGTEFYAKSYTVEEKNSLYKFLFDLPALKNMPQAEKKKALGFNYYDVAIAFAKNSAIILVSHSGIPLTEDENEILRRFAKVFEQSYTRFLDLQKAEAQARESEIELALERVRARTMAMQKSDELKEVIQVVYDQFVFLNINIEHTGFILNYKERDDMYIWLADKQQIQTQITLPYFDCAHWNSFNEAKKKGSDFFANHLTLKEKNKFYKDLFKIVPGIPEEAKEYYFSASGLAISTVLLDNVGLYIENFAGIPYTDEENNTLMRFGKVFQQTYTRFLDLQKAEAQAREAQIEAALERVRSRSMAMHNSEELLDVIDIISDQILQLGLEFTSISFGKNNQKGAFRFWLDSPGQPYPIFMEIPSINNPAPMRVVENQKKGIDFFADVLTKEENIEWIKHLIKHSELKYFPKKIQDYMLRQQGFWRSTFLLQNIDLFITNYRGEPFSEDENAIFKRFAQVFEQSYTRFLDLQKAEAQAREAQIEAALERTRTQSMIMQHSNELDDTLRVFHEQVLLLGIKSAFSFLWLPDENHDRHIFWAVWEDKKAFQSKAINYPLNRDEPATAQCLVDWKGNEPVVSYHVPPTGVEDYFAVWQELLNGVEKLKPEYFRSGLYYVEAFIKYGCFGVMVESELAEDEKKILLRFATEFERTYTRFLDLQKAEAQTRESQIQLALERVRSRSMAMHKSEELADLSLELVKQVQALGVSTWFCAFNIYDEDQKGSMEWGSNGLGTFPKYRTPREGVFLRYYKAGQNGETLLINVIGEDECPAHYEYLCNLPGVGEQLLKMKADGIPFPASQIDHVAFFKYGYILFITYEPVPESHGIFKRFAKVFEQTYTRFLDLKKAEAQARESQIEASLEKVRSRSMAMHSSQELSDVISVVSDQLQQLNIRFDHVSFAINSDAEDYHFWTALYGRPKPYELKVPYLDNPIANRAKEVRAKGLKFYQDTLTREENREWLEHAFKHNPSDYLTPEEKAYALNSGFSRSFALMPNIILNVGNYASMPYSDEDNEIIKRFAAVFEQSYTRFLDLKKAEAQAREAQIENALEKVRSRTMGMQKSEELPEAANVLFMQVQSLGIPAWSCGYNILAADKRSSICIMSSEGEIQVPFILPLTEHVSLLPWYEAIQQNLDFFEYEQGGEELVEHYRYMATIPGLEEVFKQFGNAGISLPTHQINHLVKFTNGFLLFITYESVPHAHEIFKRFGKVFEQTYTRFLDLKKAEEQTREGEIELALERIRAQAMAMRKSADLLDIVVKMRTEFISLGHEAHYFWYMRWLPDIYEKAMTSGDGSRIGMVMELPRHIHGNIKLLADWEKSSEPTVVYAMDADAAVDYVEKMITLGDFKQVDHNAPTLDDIRHIGGLTFIMARTTYGEIGFSLPGVVPNPPEDDLKTLKRFAGAFDLAYGRFEDLQKAEEQTREAQIELGLERVRARAMAMHNSDELKEVALELRTQMGLLGQKDLEVCAIHLYEEDADFFESWGAMRPPGTEDKIYQGTAYFPKAGIKIVDEMMQLYAADKKDYVIVNEKEKAVEWFEVLKKYAPDIHRTLMNAVKDIPIEELIAYWSLSDFSGGSLLLVTHTFPDESSRNLLRRSANVFDLAYRRFKDLKKAEAQAEQARLDLVQIQTEKKRAEDAFANLQQAQKQLIQAEKMASLGELTAGIAHEIQNPLNFVNNFSEVSKELLDEMKESIEKGDTEETIEIMKDVIQNLEKINHHGKRADGIVKGMLQHSRSSSGTKEPTDINALADEYLRLAYHGLRAKDKSFNAKMITEYEDGLEKINVIPQDIGRVVLNLITNAFYAVNARLNDSFGQEKKHSGI